MLEIFRFASASKIELLKNYRDYSFDSSNRDFTVDSVNSTCGGSLTASAYICGASSIIP